MDRPRRELWTPEVGAERHEATFIKARTGNKIKIVHKEIIKKFCNLF